VAHELDARKRTPAIWRWLALLLAAIVVGTGALLYAQFGSHQSTAQPAGTLMINDMDLSQSLAQKVPASTSISELPEENGVPPTQTSASNRASKTQAPSLHTHTSPTQASRNMGTYPSAASPNTAKGMEQGNQDSDGAHRISSVKGSTLPTRQPAHDAESSIKQEGHRAYNGFYQLLRKLPLDTITLHRQHPFPKTPDTALQNVVEFRNRPATGLHVKGGALLSPQFVGNEGAVELTIPIAKRLQLGMGVGYWWRPIKELNYTASGHEYGFGRSSVTIKLEPLQVHYIHLPLKLSYQLSVRHRIVGGLEANFVATTYSRIAQTTTRPESDPDAKSTNEWGYTNGFEEFHWNYLLGYEFRYSERWSLGLATKFGQGPVIESDVFNKNELENKHVSIYVQYHIW
jgi:hypothetical protein